MHLTEKDLLQKQIGQTIITQSGEDFLKDQRLMSEISILLEVTRKENEQLKGITSIMSGYISDSLEMFEQIFESDEAAFDYERMADYVTIARFMEKYTGRESIAERVSERMKDLPF